MAVLTALKPPVGELSSCNFGVASVHILKLLKSVTIH